MQFTGFPREGVKLLDEITTNNTKEWFLANRERYDQHILTPNIAYVEEMGEHLQILVPTINAIPKTNKSLFRIYRDARRHPTEPIKAKIGLIFWQGGGHRMQSSSFYMHYEVGEVFLATGIRNFKPPLLATYRDYIQNPQRRNELHTILEELQAKGYTIPEPHYKRYPAHFSPDISHAYLALHRSMFAYTCFKPDRTFHSSAMIDKSFKIYEDMHDLQRWVYEMTLHQKGQKLRE